MLAIFLGSAKALLRVRRAQKGRALAVGLGVKHKRIRARMRLTEVDAQ
jgi:hypothetical protein